MENLTNSHTFKICIVGDGGVGKTTIVHRYVKDIFLKDTKITIGTNLFIKRIEIPEKNMKVTLQIWDLGGEQKFDAIRPNFYSGAGGIIYTYDLTRRFSLMNLSKWKEEIEHSIGSVPSILIGNKLDLVGGEKKRPISKEEGLQMKEELHSSYYLETSAKTNDNIDDAFLRIARLVHNSYQKIEEG